MKGLNYEKFERGEIVWLDLGKANSGRVEVVSQSPNRMFTNVKVLNGDDNWDVMTRRLTKDTYGLKTE